ncbi:TIGR04211 family SH3 domain-containing protein [Lentisalinibacter sediminis]|uniref:TIGR04211 family SH3 domain-containing protein n=1 Tax=Lentisalinibacter sediminis TaxID=2992237 RepID=UPI00386655A8
MAEPVLTFGRDAVVDCRRMGLCHAQGRWPRRYGRVAALLALLALAPPSWAQTAYVTDNLRLGLHRAEDTSDRAFRTLESGQELTVLTRGPLYAQVRLPDGTEGWVKAGFLVDDKPARLIVDQTRAELERVKQELADTREAFSGSAGRIAELEGTTAAQAEELATARATLGELRDENEGFRRSMSLYQFSLPWPMVLGAAVVSLALGFVAGMWWIDHRSRRRHGGFRIY